MILSIPILSLLILLPAFGAFAILLFSQGKNIDVSGNAKVVALIVSSAVFFLSTFLWFAFDPSSSQYQFVENYAWIDFLNIRYHIGVDGISVLFVLLTTFLFPLCILSSWSNVKFAMKDYIVGFLFLESMIIGMFCSIDSVLFYIFFEGVLIPMFIIIGVWGGKNRIYASYKLFLYTLFGSVFMLVGLIYMYFQSGSFQISDLIKYDFSYQEQVLLFLAFFIAFAIKIPMFPFHTWLPDVHVQAPTAGSMVLAAILLKMGGYGFLRFSLPIFPDAAFDFAPLVFFLSIIAVIYTSLIAFVQTDMKKLIAYSSIAHMGLVTMGIFTFTQYGVQGAILQMMSHGLISAGLFFCIGVIYDQAHTREISYYKGLAQRMPLYSMIYVFLMMASIGLPGTSGFVGEFLVLLGAFHVNIWVSVLGATGLILGAGYSLYLVRRVIFGQFCEDQLAAMRDVSLREGLIFLSLIVMIIWMGFYPISFLNFMDTSIHHLLNDLTQIDGKNADSFLALK